MSAAVADPYAANLRRIQELEQAADIEPGSLLDGLMECIQMDDADALFVWLYDPQFGGWTLTGDESEIRARLQALLARWESEEREAADEV